MDRTASKDSLYRQASRAALLGLLVNVALGATKLIGGILGNSVALISDAVNSIGDSLVSLVVLYALRVARLPADAEHPYGHSRAEAIAGSNVAVLIIASAFLVAWHAVSGIHQVHELPPVWTLWIAGPNAVLKEALYRYKVRVGQRTGSLAVIANAWDHRADALCSLAVLVGLGLVRWGGAQFIWADEGAALVVSAAIIGSGFYLLRTGAGELMDQQANAELLRAIRKSANSVHGVRGVETLWVRKSGLEYFADIHIEVDPQITVEAGHRIGHAVKDQLLQEYSVLRDVLVHLEPYERPVKAIRSQQIN